MNKKEGWKWLLDCFQITNKSITNIGTHKKNVVNILQSFRYEIKIQLKPPGGLNVPGI
jgi:hypothetical protein